jgi:hypothetical protein
MANSPEAAPNQQKVQDFCGAWLAMVRGATSPAHLIVVSIRVEHDDAVRQDVHGIFIGKDIRRISEADTHTHSATH